MENIEPKKSSAKTRVTISILLTIAFLLTDIYFIMNQPANIGMILEMSVLVLISTCVAVSSVTAYSDEKKVEEMEQYNTIVKMQKVSYMLLKKELEELSGKIEEISKESNTDNSDEIIKTQKAIAKVSINKNKENTDAVIAESKVIYEKVLELETTLNERLQVLLENISGLEEKMMTSAVAVTVPTAATETEMSEEFDIDALLQDVLPEETEIAEEIDANTDIDSLFGMDSFEDILG